MSQQNDESKGLIMVFAFMAAALYVLAAVAFIVLAFVSLAMTCVCLFAWSSPLTIGTWTLEPKEARSFVYRGLVGSLALAALAVFAAIMFNVWIKDEHAPYILLAGYTLGSLGIEILMAQDNQQAAPPNQTIIPPSQQIAPPNQQEPPRKPFRFASWDDEDGR